MPRATVGWRVPAEAPRGAHCCGDLSHAVTRCMVSGNLYQRRGSSAPAEAPRGAHCRGDLSRAVTRPRRLVLRGHALYGFGEPLPEARLVRASRSPARGTLPRRLVPRGHAPAATCPARSRARGDLSRAVTRYMVSGASILRMERTFSRTVLAATQRESRACISASSSPNTLQAV